MTQQIRNEQILQLWDAGFDIRSIEDKFGLRPGAVLAVLRSMGIDPRKRE